MYIPTCIAMSAQFGRWDDAVGNPHHENNNDNTNDNDNINNNNNNNDNDDIDIIIIIIIITIISPNVTSSRRSVAADRSNLSIRTFRAQIYQFELFELVLLLELDRQLPVQQFEATVSRSTVPSPPLSSDVRGTPV